MMCAHWLSCIFTPCTVDTSLGGAMRLPNKPNDPNKTHYLTDYYAKTKFGLPLVPFNNSDDNALVKFYNMEPIPIKGIHFHS